MIIDPKELSLDPSNQVTADIFTQLFNLWEEKAKAMKSFVADPYYSPFTSYVYFLNIRFI